MTIIINDVQITPQRVQAGGTYLISVDADYLDYNYYARNYDYARLSTMQYKQMSEGMK